MHLLNVMLVNQERVLIRCEVKIMSRVHAIWEHSRMYTVDIKRLPKLISELNFRKFGE